jgi:SAM-dependent methyltransferase
MTATASVKDKISDIKIVRAVVKSMFLLGDNVRPIIQKPIIDGFIGNSRYSNALDAGCGRGGLYTQKLIKQADKVTAIDYSEVSINALKRRIGHLPQVSLLTASADGLPFDDEQFDIVTHCEVLEHIVDDKKVLSELYRVLRSSGKLVLSVPVPPAPIEDSEHVREGYTLEEITLLLQQAGFEVIRHQYCMFNISKNIILLQAWWSERFVFPLPSIILLPLYWERFVPQKHSDKNLPYDVVIEAKKN